MSTEDEQGGDSNVLDKGGLRKTLKNRNKEEVIVGHKITKEEFDVLYQSYADDIYRVCLYITKDDRKAQEIARQTFVNFYDQFQNVNERCIFAYLMKTAKELANSYQREVEHQEQRRMYERQIKTTYRTRAEVN